ncbi:MAG: carbohydrate-binding protein [Prevotella sp.]|nr:carbohydrate-binding protein [Prevotella sp.]
MDKRLLLGTILAFGMLLPAKAQRVMDKLDRGLVAVPGQSGGNHVSWRKLGEEYYDTQYILYRDGAKVAGPISLSNYEDTGGNSNSSYEVEAIINGVSKGKCASVKAWSAQYLTIPIRPALNRDGVDVTSGYSLNDISLADVDGDGVVELFLKRRNDSGNITSTSNKTDFNRYEVYTLQGKLLWWIDLGPNMMSGPDEQWDMIGYDWDGDGKAEALLRGADNMIIHTADGNTINIGDMTYDNGGSASTRSEYTHDGNEYLLYLNGETGVPYGYDGTSGAFTPMAYPLPRFEAGETDYATVWGSADTGHRSSKHYFGAPYLDGVHPSIFLGRGAYTRHKMCALDVNPITHELTQRWRWNTYDSSSPWFGNGYHNYQIADVDMDGRDEIMFGNMVIDDNGRGLVTTGLGHGDAQHCGDLDPYRWGLEQFECNETNPGCTYWSAATGKIYYRKAAGSDDGRALAGNFTNDYPGSEARSVGSGIIGLSSDQELPENADSKMKWDDLNMRIYWDGDLLDEIFDSPGVERSVSITKWGNSRIFTSIGQLNNSSKNNPCALGDILGDWREEFIIRNGASQLLLYTTNVHTDYDIYTLWDDHEYRNAMAWQCIGYNQPPHPSFFLGEAEGITVAPPPVTLTDRTVINNGGTIESSKEHLLLCEQADMTVNVADSASPWIVTDNAPCIVQGTGADNEKSLTPASAYNYYTHTLTGGAFSGATRVVKQGEGILVLPNVVENYTGNTDVWNGTLKFDGTLAASHLWLNRHTKLISDGGHFNAGVQADYNATIYPGAENNIGEITVSQLDLKFGSRIIFDLNDSVADKVNTSLLTLETKSWGEYGPKYKKPIFQFNAIDTLADGKYELGAIDSIQGSIENILLEGVSDKRAYLSYESGKLYINIENLRDKASIVWNGTSESSIWDFGVTENFLNNGVKDYSSLDDDITFDDSAASTDVTIKGAVRPGSLLFNNETTNYTLSGDSIVSEAPLTKNGAGSLTIATKNRLGNTTLNGGRLIVNALGNLTGIQYGALGDASKLITINNGAIFQIGRSISTDHTFNIGDAATLMTPSGTYLTINTGLIGPGAVVTKSGDGSLSLGSGNTIEQLIIKQGTVNSAENNGTIQLPQTVEFGNGILYDPASSGSYTVNSTNFVVPENCSGTLYCDPRCDYTGTLSGKGTFTVYDSWIRCNFKGDWSKFEGTLIPKINNRAGMYDNTTFDLTNSYGMPLGTLNVASDVTVNNNGMDFSVGSVIGTGTLSGDGSWIVGSNNQDFTFGLTSTSKMVKKGTGRLLLLQSNKIQNQLQVDEGTLSFSTGIINPAIGSSLTVNGASQLKASGLVSSVILNDSAYFSACSPYNDEKGGTFKTTALFRMNGNSTANFMITSGNGSNVVNSKIICGNFLYLTNVKVTLASTYTPAVGDSICLWTCSRVILGPTSISLPELPAGMAWESSSLSDKSATGYLKIVATTGINSVAADQEFAVEVFTVSGIKVGEFKTSVSNLPKQIKSLGVGGGTYIVRSVNGTHKIVMR